MESKLYSKMKRATPEIHWQRHEDKLTEGIPDTSFGVDGRCGWIELKTYDNWPRDITQPLDWHDLKPTQVNWLIARGRAAGNCYILVEVGIGENAEWYLISWEHLRKIKGMNRRQLRQCAEGYGLTKNIRTIKELL